MKLVLTTRTIRRSLSLLAATASLAAGSPAIAQSVTYSAKLHSMLATVPGPTATVTIDATCEKEGLGVAGHQICDDPGWGVGHSYHTVLTGVPVQLDPVAADVNYLKMSNGAHFSELAIGRLKGKIGALVPSQTPGVLQRSVVVDLPGLSGVGLDDVVFGDGNGDAFRLQASPIGSVDQFNPLDATLGVYAVNLLGPSETTLEGMMKVPGADAEPFGHLTTVVAAGMAFTPGGLQATFSERGTNPTTHAPIFGLEGTTHFQQEHLPMSMGIPGFAVHLAMTLGIEIHFVLEGTATTPLPAQTNPGWAQVPDVFNYDGAPIASNWVGTIWDPVLSYTASNYEATMIWNERDGSTSATSLYMGEMPPVVASAQPPGGDLGWGPDDVVSVAPYESQMKRTVKLSVRDKRDGRAWSQAATAYGPWLYGQAAWMGEASLGVPFEAATTAFLYDSRPNAEAEDYQAEVDFGDGQWVDCGAHPDECYLAPNPWWDGLIVQTTHTFSGYGKPGNPYSYAYGNQCYQQVKVRTTHSDGRQVISEAYVDLPCRPGCQDGTPEDTFSETMIGCAGHVAFSSRAGLCSEGFHVCSATEWSSGRNDLAPTHNYWTDDDLRYGGYGSMNCAVSASAAPGFSSCGSDPMRVCTATGTDAELNACNWTLCGLDETAPNDYFGGCVGNTTAGALCCQDAD